MTASSVASLPDSRASRDVLRQISSGELEAWSAEDILIWGVKNFHPRLALSASFGAPEGMVLLDMLYRIEPASRVFVLDTGRLPQATHDLIDRVRDRYEKAIEVIFPAAGDIEEMVRRHGMNLFYESVEKRQLCCRLRKVEPMRRHLAGLDAWVSGLRRDQNVTRTETRKVEIDHVHGGIVKLNPLADWTHDAVLEYVEAHEVPVNRLHTQGYPSVGCEPCSRAIQPGDDIRAGRWWWENPETKECGLHVGEEREGSGI
ncbi:MAG: phosphoadenylyl-sulfate reductase [Deltaproteobacteria bacterium]|nr:phosphoadenylyl-sulfate reductase [Deltaproteobacteria bacterium]